jgi:hypothetical protein
MHYATISSAIMIAAAIPPALAQQGQPDVVIVAQALDRCMATYAVRLTKTPASDDIIYAEAVKGCAPLNDKFVEGIKRTVPSRQATELLRDMETSKKPRFLNMLAQIRSDRAKRTSSSPAL